METLAIDRRFGWIGMFFFFFFNEHLKYQISIENYLDNEIFNLSLSLSSNLIEENFPSREWTGIVSNDVT